MKLFKKSSWAFIVLIGVVSLFSDMTHEGARGITGPFLAALGASGMRKHHIACWVSDSAARPFEDHQHRCHLPTTGQSKRGDCQKVDKIPDKSDGPVLFCAVADNSGYQPNGITHEFAKTGNKPDNGATCT